MEPGACGRPGEQPPTRPAFREVFEGQFDYVGKTVRRLGVRESDAEDVVHDVFIAVHSRLPAYDPARPLRPWVFGVAFRVVVAWLRRARNRHEVAGEPPEQADEAPLADEQLEEEQDRRLVLAALERLDPERRAVFVMHEIDGYPVPQIAETFGLPLNTAYSRLRLAREDFASAVRRLRPPRSRS